MMSKHVHEVRDPIHVFVRLDSDERAVLDSRPFQRLRHIHQLALTYLLYPAATHKRFEHSLGVMELAGRVFDVVTNPANVTDEIRKTIAEVSQPNQLQYWRRVLRMASLCHDMGHLPFPHAAEKELLPEGWDHERLTREIILSQEMAVIWGAMTPPLRPLDVVKLSLGPQKAKDLSFSTWETILSEILVGDSFGVDRMDYLLRDSYHAGVAYGRFDHFRLIDTLRILPSGTGETVEPALGIEEGGLQSAEALLLGRYYMYSQVYFHPIRRIYDIHLKDFLTAWLPGGKFPTDIEAHLRRTDNNVHAAILDAALDSSKLGHDAARRIAKHDHFKVLYQRNPDDVRINPEAGKAIFEAAQEKFGTENVRRDDYKQKREATRFPVLLRDGRIAIAEEHSEVLQHLPVVAIDYVFVRPDFLNDATGWLNAEREQLIQARKEDS
jgi:HD superfamily phosphohydrolase